MRKTDLRRLSREQRDEIHIRTVNAILNHGQTVSSVVKSFGVSKQSVYNWLKIAREKGKSALRCRKAPGRERAFSRSEECQIVYKMRSGTPEDYGLVGQLWTRELVRGLIKKTLGKHVGLSTTGRMLKRCNLSYQKPLRRAYEKDPEKVKAWRKKEFPKISREASKRRASLYFTDETNVRTNHHSGRTWSRRGKTPVINRTGKRLKINVIGASSRRGDFRFMLYTDRMNAEKFIYFLKRLMYGRRRPVVLITDSHTAHKSAAVREYVDSLAGKLRIFFYQLTHQS